MKKVYKSKVGIGLSLVTVILIASATVPLFFIEPFSWFAFILVIVTALFVIYIFLAIKYEINNEDLFIGYGFGKPLKIDINTVKEIVETNNLISSPAASLDRLEIVYEKNKRIIISPKKKHKFINDIKEINPAVIIKYKQEK